MNKNRYLNKIASSLLVCFAGPLSSTVHGATLDFGCITANDITGAACNVAESQISVDVNDIGGGQIEFVFNNTGDDLSAFIADIYFYDTGYVEGASAVIENGAGVSFSSGAKPGHLPGYTGGDIAYLADSDASVMKNGVHAGEYLGISFDLLDGVSYADALAALSDSAGFVIGIHVQGLPYGQSESLVTTAVPVPGAIWLFGSGLLGLIAAGRRRPDA